MVIGVLKMPLKGRSRFLTVSGHLCLRWLRFCDLSWWFIISIQKRLREPQLRADTQKSAARLPSPVSFSFLFLSSEKSQNL